MNAPAKARMMMCGGRIRSDTGTSTCPACMYYKVKSIAHLYSRAIYLILPLLPLRTSTLPLSSQQVMSPDCLILIPYTHATEKQVFLQWSSYVGQTLKALTEVKFLHIRGQIPSVQRSNPLTHEVKSL